MEAHSRETLEMEARLPQQRVRNQDSARQRGTKTAHARDGRLQDRQNDSSKNGIADQGLKELDEMTAESASARVQESLKDQH